MAGGTEAYEEFVVTPSEDGGCSATLTLWVMLPDGLSDEMRAAAAAGGFESDQQGAAADERGAEGAGVRQRLRDASLAGK